MDNVKKVVLFLASLGMSVDKAKNDDGKFTLADLKYLIDPGMQIGGVIPAAPLALKEWESASDEQRADLISTFKTQFDIHDDKAEKKIEAGIAMLVQAGEFFA